jgi:hypothetical protein
MLNRSIPMPHDPALLDRRMAAAPPGVPARRVPRVLGGFGAWLLAACPWSAALAAEPATIDRLAPENSLLVVAVDDAKQALERVRGTGLWALWQSERMRPLREQLMTAGSESLRDALQELGIEEEKLPLPQGPVGLAVFPVGGRGQLGLTAAGRSAPPPPPQPGFLLVADMGEEADLAGRIVEALLEKGQKDDRITVEEQEVEGRAVQVLRMRPQEDAAGDAEADDEGVDEFDEFEDMAGPVRPDNIFETFPEIHYLRDGNRVILCSDRAALRGCLEAIDGEDHAGPARNGEFQGVDARLGDGDGYVVFLMGAFFDLVEANEPMAGMMIGMLRSVVGDIRGIGMAMRFDAPAAMIEQKVAVYMPRGKAGLSELVDVPAPGREVPSFVGPDAMAYSAMGFRFEKVMDFLRGLVRANPLLGMQLDPLLAEHGPMLERICLALGPQVHLVGKLRQPVTLTSAEQVIAVRSSQPAVVEEALAKHAAGLFEPRDFLGHRIYTMDWNPMQAAMPGAPPVPAGGGEESLSVGFGAGHVFFGHTRLVEDALRAAGGGRGPALADNPDFAAAMKALGEGEAISWGLVSVVDYVQFYTSVLGQVFGPAAEGAAPIQPLLDVDAPPGLEALLKCLDPALVRAHLGATAWRCESVDDGFVVSSYLLPAQ